MGGTNHIGEECTQVCGLTGQNMTITWVAHNYLLTVTFRFRISCFEFFTWFYQSVLDMMFWALMRDWIRIFRWRTVEGKLFTSFFQEVFNSFCSFANCLSMREIWCRSRGGWDGLSFGKLLWECRIIGGE